ncbi:AHS2-domain-containing protein [Pleurotus eryngii]|uniref:AHS2-domain-containing protein n=1 Tax=Pleurotus eryngii TaxID=5323 RepID=A0A9P5ZRE4_PLEER|nr:AHS2-domain-containing protein [Pleurotus eryngii]
MALSYEDSNVFPMSTYEQHKLLVANRGEIAVRILTTARKLGLQTISVYSPSDATSLHVGLADEAIPLADYRHDKRKPTQGTLNEDITAGPTEGQDGVPESQLYLDAHLLLSICKELGATLVHPGYGFLAENAGFIRLFTETGITVLAPSADVVELMGAKHAAREIARKVGVRVCPGSGDETSSIEMANVDGLTMSLDAAVDLGKRVGFPILLKATKGGGGMGMVVCHNEHEVQDKWDQAKERAQALFGDEGLVVEKYIQQGRHIEVQIFGDGQGNVVHLGERECSVQRRHQKVIEETPSPFYNAMNPDERDAICQAAIRIGKELKYSSAGTVEFLVDASTGEFCFLEVNTRIQVEHGITEAMYPGLDLVQLMIDLGIAVHSTRTDTMDAALDMDKLAKWIDGTGRWIDELPTRNEGLHAIEARIYAENPAEGFRPCPGLLQLVDIPDRKEEGWLRVDSWISTGTIITPHFDPLLCKVIVTGGSRDEAIARMKAALTKTRICGPPNNIEHLQVALDNPIFAKGCATTRWLENLPFVPRAVTVVSSGLDMTVQDLPGRVTGLGLPRSGPMDYMAFQAANLLVGNKSSTEGLEIIVMPGIPAVFIFHVPTIIAVTGKPVSLSITADAENYGKFDAESSKDTVSMWRMLSVPGGAKLRIEDQANYEDGRGFRVYLAVRGGLPTIPEYLKSKSTSMGLGGYQGRSLLPGDQLALGECGPKHGEEVNICIPEFMIPTYPLQATIYVLSGPQDDPEFITAEGIEKFYAAKFIVSPSSNRMGIRLERSNGSGDGKIGWARENGGEGGSHPSNILDNAYAFGSVNINGDTPVILANEGPDMGGYVCACTIAQGDMWKLGQLGPGNEIRFRRVSWDTALRLRRRNESWLGGVRAVISNSESGSIDLFEEETEGGQGGPKLLVVKAEEGSQKPTVTFRTAGDSAILVDFGEMRLDFSIRALVHAFELEVLGARVDAIKRLCPCIRSTMCHYDPLQISQSAVLDTLSSALRRLPDVVDKMEFPSREITFPIVPDDPWCQEAIDKYARTTRGKAVYVPSNVDYLSRNNGLDGKEDALSKLIDSEWLVVGIGFYLACPFLVPIDPRCRLVGQKMNPSRTYTPRGAIGIAGVVAAIYPVESPGGYQLYGRTLPAWQTWGRGRHFSSEEPWLLRPFDKVRFKVVDVGAYSELEQQFDAGRYEFEVSPATFSMKEYSAFVQSIAPEIKSFRDIQGIAVAIEEERERALLMEWEAEKRVASVPTQVDNHAGTAFVRSPIFANIWKIKVKIGDTIVSKMQAVVILESMKSEINVYPEENAVGRKVVGYGDGIGLGAAVRPGDIIVHLA